MVKDFFRSRTGVLWLGMFASMLYFVIVWSLGTTFRGMSNWVLYPINLMAAGVLTLPYMLSRYSLKSLQLPQLPEHALSYQ